MGLLKYNSMISRGATVLALYSVPLVPHQAVWQMVIWHFLFKAFLLQKTPLEKLAALSTCSQWPCHSDKRAC